ncbi:hypothetical protein AVEN_10106-1 [Araneus ventricosus]|uniref:Uncharacterized protein n=1 Tax=Araneus ventricosus TaxID=182803 RepID=A0A4Y2TGK2_ARAVE|nr:hypothetical protein AVEN_10106-1 [Araneus ventricosus]
MCVTCTPFYSTDEGHCGLVIRSRIRGRRFTGSKPYSTEETPCKRAWCTLNQSEPSVLPLVWLETLEKGCQLRCSLRHLTAVQNFEVRPKIALVLLQIWT